MTEENYAYYAQFNFNYDVLDGRLVGSQRRRPPGPLPEVNAQGETTAGRPIYGDNSYDDTLPAGNVTFEAFHNLHIRAAAAKVMARPLLGNLSPAVTGISVPSDGSSTGGTLTVGNPKLSPFRWRGL